MGIGKITGSAVYHAATKAAKSPFVKGAALGAAGVTTVNLLKHNKETDGSGKKIKAAAALGTLAGGAAILFLAGKATGASSKNALSAGYDIIIKTGMKNLISSVQATPIGKKITTAAAGALTKAKSILGKIKGNPKIENATGKIKETAGKIKDNPKLQAAVGKIKDNPKIQAAAEKAGKLKNVAAEKIKTTASKLKGIITEKIKSAASKVKEALSHIKNSGKVQAISQKTDEITEIATENLI